MSGFSSHCSRLPFENPLAQTRSFGTSGLIRHQFQSATSRQNETITSSFSLTATDYDDAYATLIASARGSATTRKGCYQERDERERRNDERKREDEGQRGIATHAAFLSSISTTATRPPFMHHPMHPARPSSPIASSPRGRGSTHPHSSLPPLLHAVHAWQSGGVSTSRRRPGLISHKTSTSTRDETLKARGRLLWYRHNLYEATADPKERRLRGKVDFDPIAMGWNRWHAPFGERSPLNPSALNRSEH